MCGVQNPPALTDLRLRDSYMSCIHQMLVYALLIGILWFVEEDVLHASARSPRPLSPYHLQYVRVHIRCSSRIHSAQRRVPARTIPSPRSYHSVPRLRPLRCPWSQGGPGGRPDETPRPEGGRKIPRGPVPQGAKGAQSPCHIRQRTQVATDQMKL